MSLLEDNDVICSPFRLFRGAYFKMQPELLCKNKVYIICLNILSLWYENIAKYTWNTQFYCVVERVWIVKCIFVCGVTLPADNINKNILKTCLSIVYLTIFDFNKHLLLLKIALCWKKQDCPRTVCHNLHISNSLYHWLQRFWLNSSLLKRLLRMKCLFFYIFNHQKYPRLGMWTNFGADKVHHSYNMVVHSHYRDL